MALFTDQLGRRINLEGRPNRIVSVVPSQTELLHHLGLSSEVVGITKFCVHPDSWFRAKTRVGGTKNINLEKVRALQPDLIIANKEENTKAQIEELAASFPVWVSDVNTLEQACEMITAVGALTGSQAAATALATGIMQAFAGLATTGQGLAAAYLIWKDPFMTVGGDTFIHHLLQRAGFSNVFEERSRYPAVSIAELQERKPQVLLLSSEPYPFKEAHVQALQQQLPGAKVVLADGELFSWYGSRLLQSPPYFAALQKRINGMQ